MAELGRWWKWWGAMKTPRVHAWMKGSPLISYDGSRRSSDVLGRVGNPDDVCACEKDISQYLKSWLEKCF